MAIKLDTLTVGHTKGRHRRPVLQGLHGELPPLVCLLGANGCGKTTLLRTIMGFIPPLQGSVWVNGLNVHHTPRAELAAHLAYVPQRGPEANEHRVLDMVVMGTLQRWKGWYFAQGPQPKHCETALHALEQVGIAHLQHQCFGELSGGQQQLVTLARALAQGANTLVLDEPTANLDPYNVRKVGQVLHGLVHTGATVQNVVISTHHPELALQMNAHCLLLRQGQVMAQGSANLVLTEESMEGLYTD